MTANPAPSAPDIRRTTPDDWRALKAVRLAALRDAPDAFGLKLSTALAYTDDDWRDRASCRVAEYFLAFEGVSAIGMIGGHCGSNGEYELIAMWVQSPMRGTQVASRLVDAIKASAVRQGHHRIVLAVAPENARAAAFYLRQGFDWLPERYPLDSNPSVLLQKMAWEVRDEAAAVRKSPAGI